ncbi:unnamed protein product [Medioppia subpectinata]|uniref:Protein kinase domain-containing protein n=1 Tax=Medioppia subpectinata TaxID=1979941 RepID=A0A7R9KX20_9ACAR|nr:unnamed protein product [Medioppia subpectinata]CAG2110150.1 unnamed protein product [Medioppia subpectinata]
MMYNGKYKKQFVEMSAIGSGGFGTVFKVKDRLDDKIYAIKRMEFDFKDISDQQKLRRIEEVKNLVKLNSQYVVKCYYSWLECNYLYIQMEYCSQSLKSVLKDKHIVFGRQPDEAMKVFEYFISCEIFKEILECVHYLHTSCPQVIHRDLKPDNILIKHNIKFNRFIKLCDFGLATEHMPTSSVTSSGNPVSQSHSPDTGTFQYIAPEVHKRRYNTKADIYSMGVIAQHIFDLFDIDGPTKKYRLTTFSVKFNRLYKNNIQSMVNFAANERPNCIDVLQDYNNWSVGKHFKNCDIIPTNMGNIITKLHVFRDLDNCVNVLFKTSDDMVYVFGDNSNGCLGLRHNNPILSPELIPQLCQQNIQYFVNGCDFVLAVNDLNVVHGFGNNYWGQLGPVFGSFRIDTPFNLKIDLPKPGIISYLNDTTVAQITCGYNHVLALTSKGRVYAWGPNRYGQIGCGYTLTWRFPLTKHELNFNIYNIQTVYCYYRSSFAITTDGLVFSWGDNSGHHLGHNISDDNFSDNNYKQQFIEISTISSGGFGTVFQVKHRLDDKIYAVKRVQFGGKYHYFILMKTKNIEF